MKKIFLLLLAAVMVFSLAACGSKYDKEFTIKVGGSGEWTPFENASGVTFANSAESIISISDNGTKVAFTGLSVGESVITATYDGKESKALVRVSSVSGNGTGDNGGDSGAGGNGTGNGGAGSGNDGNGTGNAGNSGNGNGNNNNGGKTTMNAPDISYNPPADYYIERKDSKGNTTKYCKIGNNYTFVHPDGLTQHYSGDTMLEYGMPDGSTWYQQDDSAEAHKEAVTAALEEAARPLNDFFEILYLFKNSRDGAVAKQFYVRTEKVLDRDCGVYELYDNGQLGHGNCRVWVDLKTGCWLKYQNLDENTTFEVLAFKLTGLDWNSKLRPEPYGSAIIP